MVKVGSIRVLDVAAPRVLGFDGAVPRRKDEEAKAQEH